jgi:hypothetical protein
MALMDGTCVGKVLTLGLLESDGCSDGNIDVDGI